MDKEVRRTEQELNNVLDAVDKRLMETGKISSNVNQTLKFLSQELESASSSLKQVLKSERLLEYEYGQLVEQSKSKEQAIAEMQRELTTIFAKERIQHKDIFSDLTTKLAKAMNQKVDFDALKHISVNNQAE